MACYMKISSSSILILCPQYNFLRTFFEGKNFQLRTFSVIFQFWKEREYVGEREMCCNVKDIVINTVLPLCPEPSFVERVTHVVHLDCVLCKSIPFRWDKEEHGDVGEYCVDCVATHTLFCFVQISCLSFHSVQPWAGPSLGVALCLSLSLTHFCLAKTQTKCGYGGHLDNSGGH